MIQSRYLLSDYVNLVFQTPSLECSEWFGYYNYDPLNYDHTKLLCNRALFDGIAPQKGMSIELGFYCILTGKWHHIAYTDSWNWQQGAMLQWLPGLNNKNKVIYNCTRNNHNIACIYDIVTRETKEIDWSIYGITPDGKKSIALEMERSHWCRAYHYKSVSNVNWDGRVVEEDGIFEIDLEKNSRKRLISIKEIIELDFVEEFNSCKHWLEHIMISHDGSRFSFLHRYSPENNVYSYKTRVCIANIDGSELKILKDSDKYQWSHFGWANNNDFCVYTYKLGMYSTVPSISDFIHGNGITFCNVIKKLVLVFSRVLPSSLRKKITGKNSYYQFYKCDDKGNYVLHDSWQSKLFEIDGHPSFTITDKYIITDTYPDQDGLQHLIVFNTENKKGLVIAKFYANYQGNPASCDLHPKLSIDNTCIVVDTAYDEKHHMMVFEPNWKLIEKVIS